VWCRLINMLYVRYKHSTIHDVLAHGLIPTTPSMGHLQASPSKMLTYCEYVQVNSASYSQQDGK